jgi:hypothetical protein
MISYILQCIHTKYTNTIVCRYSSLSLYFSGAQHIDVGDGVQYHTIGSAHENNPSQAHVNTVTKSQLKFHTGSGDGGFASVEIKEDGMVVVHRDGDGKVLYTAPAIPPRS